MKDESVVARQLGRTPRAFRRVVVRCPYGHPAVTEQWPRDATGAPFPTTYYLTCPHLVAAISRLEADGGVERWTRAASENPALGESLERADAEQRSLRPELPVGIAGTRRVAAGDLATRIPANARHELGDLARAFNDMTGKLADARRQLVQADKLASVGRLAAGVAHEINNPLTGVLTYASLLRERFADTPEVAADLDVIVRETKRCRDIVRGLLDFARMSPPRHRPVDLNEVVRRAVAVVVNQLTLSRVRLDIGLATALPAVPADANQIQQVVVNLLMNAADAVGAEGGTIRIATAEAAVPRAVELTVEDSGRGIAPEDMDHLFEPFFTTKGNRGLGLGLAVTWGIVEAHHGTIEVKSEPGHGARFTVRLPRTAPRATSDAEGVEAKRAEPSRSAADAARPTEAERGAA